MDRQITVSFKTKTSVREDSYSSTVTVPGFYAEKWDSIFKSFLVLMNSNIAIDDVRNIDVALNKAVEEYIENMV